MSKEPAYLVLAAAVALTASCATRGVAQPAGVRALLEETITRRVAENPDWYEYAPIVADSLVIESEPSRAVPGLVYSRGIFLPPQTADVIPFGAVVISRGGRLSVLATPGDWSAAADGWYPPNASVAAVACEEIANEIDRFGGNQVVFRDSIQISPLIVPANLPVLLERVRAPTATRIAPDTWEAAVWLVRANETVEFRCLFRPTRPSLDTRIGNRVAVGLTPMM